MTSQLSSSIDTAGSVDARACHPIPAYRGKRWVNARLPERSEDWVRPAAALRVEPGGYLDAAHAEQVSNYLRDKPWVWPSTRLLFFCDLHADATAFLASLVASGGVEKVGPEDTDFVLTAEGRSATFLIAGDCLDKGPNNLRLLRTVEALIQTGANVVILAGNHDVRALLGMACAGNKDPQLAHLFVRMGKKCVPLLKELADAYVPETSNKTTRQREQALHRELFPDDEWFRKFPRAAAALVHPDKIEHEIKRIREKMRDFETHCAQYDLSLARVRGAIDAFSEHFTRPGGDFAWYFERMQLAHRLGSLLFIHGGVDDHVAHLLRDEGTAGLNLRFRRMLEQQDYFDLYHGPIGNTFRTKYRDTDFQLSEQGLGAMHDAGIYAIAHGHRNIPYGQRAIFRQGMLNFECDASVDRNTRHLLELSGPGAACTLFLPDGRVLGISTDYPAGKLFDPAQYASLLTLV